MTLSECCQTYVDTDIMICSSCKEHLGDEDIWDDEEQTKIYKIKDGLEIELPEREDKSTIISGMEERNRLKRAGLTLKRESILSQIEWTCEGQISEDEAQTLQRKSGYPPEGYGFWGHRFKEDKTEWQSARSSE